MIPILLAGCRHWLRRCVYAFKRCFSRDAAPRPVWVPLPLERFNTIYLSCKHEAEMWPVYQLLLIKLLHVGAPAAFDAETGQLLPQLDCSWLVIGFVFVGEVAGDVLSAVVRWVLGRWAPCLVLDVPTSSVQPSSSPVVTTLVFLNLGYVVHIGVSGMGSVASAVVESQQQKA